MSVCLYSLLLACIFSASLLVLFAVQFLCDIIFCLLTVSVFVCLSVYLFAVFSHVLSKLIWVMVIWSETPPILFLIFIRSILFMTILTMIIFSFWFLTILGNYSYLFVSCALIFSVTTDTLCGYSFHCYWYLKMTPLLVPSNSLLTCVSSL